MKKTGIAFLFASCIALNGCKNNRSGEYISITEPDTTFISKSILLMNQQKDSVPVRYSSGRFAFSPDSNFRVCTVEGEICNTYCNPCYSSQFLIKAGKRGWKRSLVKKSLGRVLQIGNIPESGMEYFMIDGSWHRPHEIEMVEYCNLYHLRLRNGDIEFLPMINTEEDTVDYLRVYYSSSACDLTGEMKIPYYDNVHKRIYSFIQEFNDGGNIKCKIQKRIVVFENGIFIEKEER